MVFEDYLHFKVRCPYCGKIFDIDRTHPRTLYEYKEKTVGEYKHCEKLFIGTARSILALKYLLYFPNISHEDDISSKIERAVIEACTYHLNEPTDIIFNRIVDDLKCLSIFLSEEEVDCTKKIINAVKDYYNTLYSEPLTEEIKSQLKNEQRTPYILWD